VPVAKRNRFNHLVARTSLSARGWSFWKNVGTGFSVIPSQIRRFGESSPNPMFTW